MEIKKFASVEELEALKNLIHYENSGEHKSQDTREKVLVDFTKPIKKIKNIYETADTKKIVCLGKDSFKNRENLLCEILSSCDTFVNGGAEYFQILESPEKSGVPCPVYFEIYRDCAIALKEKFPNIKVGAGSFSDCVGDYVHEFMNCLLLDKRVPLDFFSWHKEFKKAEQLQNYTYAARTLLDKYGFCETENVISSWSFGATQNTSENAEVQMKEASFVVASLISLQKTPADFAVFGNKQTEKCNLAFDAFKEIASLGIEVTSDSVADHVYILGAKDDDKGAFLVSNFNPYEKAEHEIVLDLKGTFGKKCEIYLLNKENNLTLVYNGNTPKSYKITPESVVLIKLV